MSSYPVVFGFAILLRAVDFLFDNARSVLEERYQKRKLQRKQEINDKNAEEMEALSSIIVNLSIYDKSKFQSPPTKPLEQWQVDELQHLLGLLEIETRNRRRAQKQIALQGGDVFATPPTLSTLEISEEKITELSIEIAKLIDNVYGSDLIITSNRS